MPPVSKQMPLPTRRDARAVARAARAAADRRAARCRHRGGVAAGHGEEGAGAELRERALVVQAQRTSPASREPLQGAAVGTQSSTFGGSVVSQRARWLPARDRRGALEVGGATAMRVDARADRRRRGGCVLRCGIGAAAASAALASASRPARTRRRRRPRDTAARATPGLTTSLHQLAGELEPLEGARAGAQESDRGQRVARVRQPCDQQRRLLATAPDAAMEALPQLRRAASLRSPRRGPRPRSRRPQRPREPSRLARGPRCAGAARSSFPAGGSASRACLDPWWSSADHCASAC